MSVRSGNIYVTHGISIEWKQKDREQWVSVKLTSGWEGSEQAKSVETLDDLNALIDALTIARKQVFGV